MEKQVPKRKTAIKKGLENGDIKIVIGNTLFTWYKNG